MVVEEKASAQGKRPPPPPPLNVGQIGPQLPPQNEAEAEALALAQDQAQQAIQLPKENEEKSEAESDVTEPPPMTVLRKHSTIIKDVEEDKLLRQNWTQMFLEN